MSGAFATLLQLTQQTVLCKTLKVSSTALQTVSAHASHLGITVKKLEFIATAVIMMYMMPAKLTG